MDRLKLLKRVNVFLFLSALVQAVTGLVIFFLNEGPVVVLIEDIHKYNGPVLGILIGTHLWLNWSVVKSHYFTRKTG